MKNAKKILITSATSEFFIIRRGRQKTFRGFCPNCAAETEMLTLDEAVILTGKSTLELVRPAESDAIHTIESASGHLLVCQNSLRNFTK